MADPKKAVAKNYASAYSDDAAGRSSRYTDRLNAFDNKDLGGSFAKKGEKKNNRQGYRDRQSGKTFYVNQRGEFVTQGGSPVDNNFTKGLEERVQGAANKNFNRQFETEQRALGNRPDGDQGNKSLQEQLTSRGISEGKNVAEASQDALQVEREDRAAFKIANDLRGAQGYADPDEVARRTAGQNLGAVSPLTKNSPLYRNFKDFSGGATGYDVNYATLSEQIGSSVDEAVSENRATQDRIRQEEDRQREQERQDLNTQIQQNTYQQQKIKQAEGLVVAGDTGYNNVNSAVEGASRGLADSAGALTAQLNKNEIGIDEFSQKYAQIKAQVPGIKKWKETLTTNLEGYKQGLDSGQLSAANSTQTNELYASLLADDGRYQLTPDENGVVMFTGQTDSGDPVSIPVNGIDQMPTPTLKSKSPYELLKPSLKELQGSLNTWNDDASNVIKGQLDVFLSEAGEPGLKSLAVDHYNLSLEETNALIDDTSVEGYSNKLEKYIEEKFIADASLKFVADQLTAAQEADLNLKKQQLAQKAKQGGGDTAADIKRADDEFQTQQNTQILSTISQGISTGNQDAAKGLIGRGTVIDVSTHSFGGGFTIKTKEGGKHDINTVEAVDAAGNKTYKIDPQSQQILNSALGLGAVGNSDPLGLNN